MMRRRAGLAVARFAKAFPALAIARSFLTEKSGGSPTESSPQRSKDKTLEHDIKLQNIPKQKTFREAGQNATPTEPQEPKREMKMEKTLQTIDANQAAAMISYAFSDSAFVFPITPSSVAGEFVDEWSAAGLKNCFDQEVQITEMQSEGGAIAALHGALKAGVLSTTYTASQGLLLMIPNLFKIAGELLPCAIHICTRAVASHALSIFGDHSDMYAIRQTGWSLLVSDNAQTAHDLAIVAHLATLDARVPIAHCYEGFRTSHEILKVDTLPYSKLKQLIPMDLVRAHRDRALHPDHPHIQGQGQGFAVYFQAAEAANPFYDALPDKIEKWMNTVAEVTGRKYNFFEYVGHSSPEHVIVLMGSAGLTAAEYVKTNPEEKIGVIAVRVYRPWCAERFLKAIPASVKRITVLDRAKDPAAQGEPLFLDVAACLQSAQGSFSKIEVVHGRYGISGKEFTPGLVKAVFKNMKSDKMRNGFVLGINDDVTFRSIPAEDVPDILPPKTKQCLFVGIGSDGTIIANKTAVKIIGEQTSNYAQAFFQYDAKKSGSRTVSHLRFGPSPINAPYVIQHADYIAIHNTRYVFELPRLLTRLKNGGTVVVNTSIKPSDAEAKLPGFFKQFLAQKKAKLYFIDALQICKKIGLEKRINMVMQSVFFYLTEVIPFSEASAFLKSDIRKLFQMKGEEIVAMNERAVDDSLKGLTEINVPEEWLSAKNAPKEKVIVGGELTPERQKYITECMNLMNTMRGEMIPVSKFTPGGVMPTGTSWAEKRGVATQVPLVDMDKCTQCNYCSLLCPHAAIRPFLLTPADVEKAPSTVKSTAKPAIGGGVLDNYQYRIQVSPLDCTGCEVCSQICPSDALVMQDSKKAMREKEGENWNYCITLPNYGDEIDKTTVKGSQFQKPLLEFNGACEGCGETAYVKLLTQLFGQNMVLASATGCSRVWGATVSSSYTVHKGRGPAFGNSLFEDNAEYGYGLLRSQVRRRELLLQVVDAALADPTVKISDDLRGSLEYWSSLRHQNKVDPLLSQGKSLYRSLSDRIIPLLEKEKGSHNVLQKMWLDRDYFMRISMWSIGGDGWAYDIGFGGLDHVIASGDDAKILVMDNEMYSNTGGQVSKASNFSVSQKFAATGKGVGKKDLGQYAIATYRNVYVASVCINANHQQTLRALLEAEAYPGPALIIAYSPCMSHGYPMTEAVEHAKQAVETGYWPLYRYNPLLALDGNPPFQLDSKRISGDVLKLLAKENRFVATSRRDAAVARKLEGRLVQQVEERFKHLQYEAKFSLSGAAEASTDDSSMLILYGSETGNAEELARGLASDSKARGVKSVTVSSLDDFQFEELPNVSNLVVICSTCGLGEFPQNARKFRAAIENPDLPASLLSKVKFSVFGLGDSTYSQFCVAAERIDIRLAELGAKRLVPRGVGDDRDSDRFYTGWEAWQPKCFTSLNLPKVPFERKPPVPSYTVEIVPGRGKPVTPLSELRPVGSVPLILKENRLLTPPGYDRDIRHYTFSLGGSNLRYSCGDSLAVFPQNDPKRVQEFCKFYGLTETDELRIERKPDARNPLPAELSVGQLFTVYLDIFGKPSRKFYEHLYNFATDEGEKKQLEAIFTDTPDGKKVLSALMNEYATFDDVLRKFPSAHPPLEHLMNIVPLIRPRSYSISSSPLMHPESIHLSVVKVDWNIPSTNEIRGGLATSYLIRQSPESTINVGIRKSAIHLPSDVSTPIIMCGMGTGLAPWRAVTQHRAAQAMQGKKVGPVVLFFGARKEKQEFLYREEFLKYAEMGVLELHTAFSRDQAHKIYVQHRIIEQSKRVYDLVVNKDAHFYVCGTSRNVPEDVYNAMKKVIMEQSETTEIDAEAYLISMRKEGRYVVEAWA